MNAPTDAQLIDFVLDEAALLDALRYDDWLALFTDDGHYWMPLAPGQTDARLHASLLYEDRLLLQVRIERLRGARTFSQQPVSRCHHLLQAPRVTARDDAAGIYHCRTAFHYIETRQDEQTLYAGWASHELVCQGYGQGDRQGDGQGDATLRMRLKRVDLVNCDAAFGNMQLFM